MDLKKPQFKETVKRANKVVKGNKKGDNAELKLFLKGVPRKALVAVLFVVLEALLGVGVTLVYLVKFILSLFVN